MTETGQGPPARATRPPLALALLGGAGRLPFLRRGCHALVGAYLARHPQHAIVRARIAGLPSVVDLRETMERTIFLRGTVDSRGIALMRWALRDIAGPVIFDVGANVGNHSAAMRDIAGQIHAFEPNPALYARLAEMIAANGIANIRAEGVALSDHEGVATLKLRDGESERAHLSSGGKGVAVEMTTGDAYVRRKGIDRLDLIKIDVEGHEPAVLAGLSESLRRFRPLVVFERYLTTPDYSSAAFSQLLPDYQLLGTRRRRLMTGAPRGSRLEPFCDARPYAAALAVPSERADSVLGGWKGRLRRAA